MRAIWLTAFGPPQVLVAGEAPDPAPGPGDVVIDVAFANITFVETQFRATGRGPFAAEPPFIPGNGVGGVVAGLGAGVDPGLLGARVVAGTGGTGGYAVRAAAPFAELVAVPDAVALDDAVALMADGRTATLLLDAAAPRPGERVLIEAAAGGVGSLLVQLANAAGATVVAAAGGARKVALARELGADIAVDYTRPGWADAAGPVDVVLDGVGGAIARSAFDLIVPGGRMLSYGLASGAWAEIDAAVAAARDVYLLPMTRPAPEQARAATARVLAQAAEGVVRPVIGQRVALEHAAQAHAAIEARTTVGKTLLVVD